MSQRGEPLGSLTKETIEKTHEESKLKGEPWLLTSLIVIATVLVCLYPYDCRLSVAVERALNAIAPKCDDNDEDADPGPGSGHGRRTRKEKKGEEGFVIALDSLHFSYHREEFIVYYIELRE